ncbi:hypothetical protein MNBD_GAMMA11-2901 [hydrothermal vent metagenome]|uniref:DUF2608 domain-containing protein n=1 Tax=hydrothermal vent metagenome TaxID=652676 RepID=A0A3B0WTT6_9ZZZZ
MKKHLNYIILFVVFNCSYVTSYAEPETTSVSNFSGLKKAALAFGENEIKNTLIVMDNDDTLTMMKCLKQKKPGKCQYLGGPAWFSWQSDLISNDPTSRFKIAENNDNLLQISALLLSMNNMLYAEDTIPSVLKYLTNNGATLLVLTARGGSNISATESQFSNLYLNNKNDDNLLKFISDHALNGKKSGISSIAGPIQPRSCMAERPISYRQGIMYVAGQNKGMMLNCILDRTDSTHIKNIIFIDDTQENVDDVYNEFKHSKKYSITAMHYTYLEKHKERLTLHHKYKKKARKRWENIKSILINELLFPSAIR